MFAEQGAAASTEAVAARAGVAIGTVFRHFPTKPELLQAVVMNLWDRLVAQKAGPVRVDLQSAELIALLAAICQEAMTDEWSEQFRHRALTILFDGMRPTPKP